MKNQSIMFLTGMVLISCLLVSMASKGQPGDQYESKKEMIKSHKIAFITDRLALTPEEAQRFWPVYNEYEANRETIQREMFKAYDLDEINIDALTDEEATEVADNQIIKSQKLLDLRKEYHIKFKSVLPIKKVLKLYQAEREFQHELIKKIRDDHAPGMPPRR